MVLCSWLKIVRCVKEEKILHTEDEMACGLRGEIGYCLWEDMVRRVEEEMARGVGEEGVHRMGEEKVHRVKRK